MKTAFVFNGSKMWLVTVAVFFCPAEEDVEAVDSMEIPLAEEPATTIKFSYSSNAQMINILKTTEDRCAEIARTYSIGPSMEGRELLVIEFSNNPGKHELRKLSLSKCVYILHSAISKRFYQLL